MTIDRQQGQIFISCDACGEVTESERHAVFAPFWKEQRELGWRSKELPQTNAASDWEHYCPKCARLKS